SRAPRSNEPRHQRRQQFGSPRVVRDRVVPGPQEGGDDRTGALRRIRVLLAGDVRHRLHHAHTGFRRLVRAGGEHEASGQRPHAFGSIHGHQNGTSLSSSGAGPLPPSPWSRRSTRSKKRSVLSYQRSASSTTFASALPA